MLEKFFKSNLIRRILTAVVLAPLVLLLTYLGGLYFLAFLLLILGLSLFEFFSIIATNKTVGKKGKWLWSIAGFLYICLAIYSLYFIRDNGYPPYHIFILFFSIWIFDSGAYFIGSIIGGPKLMPKISPKKTWSGLLGGIFFTALFPLAYFFISALFYMKFSQIWKNPYMLDLLALFILISLWSIAFGLVGQVGDLLQSYFKRKFGVKDSGGLLPGHGGVLDRMDSIFLAAIFLFVMFGSGFVV
jgi:phosphatidate cytidylyltransferase